MSQANQAFEHCSQDSLEAMLGSNAVHNLSSEVLPHSTLAILSCRTGFDFSGTSEALCINGTWKMTQPISCTCELCFTSEAR